MTVPKFPVDGCPECVQSYNHPYRVEVYSAERGLRAWYRCHLCRYSWWTSWAIDAITDPTSCPGCPACTPVATGGRP